MMNDNIYTEFQLPLKGFYRHFKEMTETSKSNHFLQLIFRSNNQIIYPPQIPVIYFIEKS